MVAMTVSPSRTGCTLDENSSESVPTTVIDRLGDPVTLPNATVFIESDLSITYTPKEDFNGSDYFTYTIRDLDGEESTATVHVTVTPENDAPYGFAQITYSVEENGFLDVLAPGLLLDARDPDGDPLFLVLQDQPANGGLLLSPDGSFTYTPDVDFSGSDRFTYFLTDTQTTNLGGPLEVLIQITPAPPAPAPPPPGEVEFDFQLADLPLELIKSTEANVLVLMDDSGSMDWSLSAPEEREGRFLISTRGVSGVNRQSSAVFSYVHALSSNTYNDQSDIGRVVPSEEALAADSAFNGNRYGVWRARSHKYNRMYYNPEIQYLPWRGLDPDNVEFASSDPTAALLDPMQSDDTIDLTEPVDYLASNVPCMQNCRQKNVDVNDYYTPRYYSTPEDGPFLEWNDAHTLVEIRSGSSYTGGPGR